MSKDDNLLHKNLKKVNASQDDYLMGQPLFDHVTDLTGLPEDQISLELEEILQKAGSSPEGVTIDDLRYALMQYLTEVFGPLIESESSGTPPSK